MQRPGGRGRSASGARRVAIAGSLAQRPGKAGHAWVFLQYLLGFRRLGWDVLFLDRLEPGMCHDAHGRRCAPAESVNLAYLDGVMQRFGLGDAYAVSLDGGGGWAGRTRADVDAWIGDAILLNVMGFCNDEQLLARAALRVFLDIDPGFGQMWHALELADLFRGHDRHVTIGENIGRPECAIPTCGIDWITTPQPVVLEQWDTGVPDAAARDAPFTSVVTWRGPFGPVDFGGRRYGLRVHEFRRFAELPRLAGGAFELALDIEPADEADRARLVDSGWSIVDPDDVASTPDGYRDYVHASAAEFMVAKNMYVDTRSGWLSDRSLCYLASGRPVLAQDTGFRHRYPADAGLVAFTNVDDAIAGVHAIRGDYRRHAAAARDIAAEYFDSDRVLGSLVDRLAATPLPA